MEKHQARINIEKFRAIHKADIIIDGITIITGENGSGKSSLSKITYLAYTSICNYEQLVISNLEKKLKKVEMLNDILYHEFFKIKIVKADRNNPIPKKIPRFKFTKMTLSESIEYLEQMAEEWSKMIVELEKSYVALEEDKKVSYRLTRIIEDIIGNKDDVKKNDKEELFVKINQKVNDGFNEAIKQIRERPNDLLLNKINSIFKDAILPNKLEIFEYNELITSLSRGVISISYNIQNTLYIDSPLITSIEDSDNEIWTDLQKKIVKNGNHSNDIATLIQKEIIKGDIIVDENGYNIKDDVQYKRADGATFYLNEVATGIKSFTLLLLLLKNNLLTDKTLLIIDEPECNLHPQWIVEYARVVVMLNRQLGVKFLIASHDPDMVSAIKYISEKQKISENVNFYLAKKTNTESYFYDYTCLKNNIDPIFESFNIALDKINEYGE